MPISSASKAPTIDGRCRNAFDVFPESACAKSEPRSASQATEMASLRARFALDPTHLIDLLNDCVCIRRKPELLRLRHQGAVGQEGGFEKRSGVEGREPARR